MQSGYCRNQDGYGRKQDVFCRKQDGYCRVLEFLLRRRALLSPKENWWISGTTWAAVTAIGTCATQAFRQNLIITQRCTNWHNACNYSCRSETSELVHGFSVLDLAHYYGLNLRGSHTGFPPGFSVVRFSSLLTMWRGIPTLLTHKASHLVWGRGVGLSKSQASLTLAMGAGPLSRLSRWPIWVSPILFPPTWRWFYSQVLV
jgi:hypothetical protein